MDYVPNAPEYDETIPVLIVGGSLVGLSMSLFLSQHNIPSLLLERHAGSSPHPRAFNFNARTMELFRAAQVEEALLSLNDELATWPRFAVASADEKQNTYDSLIFVMTVLVTYNDVGARDQITHDAGVALAGKVVRTLASEPKAH